SPTGGHREAADPSAHPYRRACRLAESEHTVTEPLISVVIVSYQTRELTLRCLARLRAASPTVPYEVIVVDNASTAGSAAAIASSEPSATVLRLRENVGFGGAVNVGAARASGRWLLLMNPDTTPVTDVLAAFLAAAQA